MSWYIKVLKKYAVFSGRATRQEYWMFTLIHIAISFALLLFDGVVGSGGILYYIYSFAVALPSLGVVARRLHDTDRSGWWMLIAFVPLIGFIAMIVFLVKDSDQFENRYGENPYGPDPKIEMD